MTAIQTAEIDVTEGIVQDEAAKMYNELVKRGEDPVDAAWLVDDHFGFTENRKSFSIYDDPFAPDYDALGAEPVTSQIRDSEGAAEGPSIQ